MEFKKRIHGPFNLLNFCQFGLNCRTVGASTNCLPDLTLIFVNQALNRREQLTRHSYLQHRISTISSIHHLPSSPHPLHVCLIYPSPLKSKGYLSLKNRLASYISYREYCQCPAECRVEEESRCEKKRNEKMIWKMII